MSPENPVYTLIEGPLRLSQSALWKLVAAWYESQSVEAFRTAIVPHYITTNVFVARTYANLVLAWLRDLREAGRLDPHRPVYLVELGSATGRFAYHFLRMFLPRLRQSSLRDTNVKFVLSDVVPANLEFWRTHPRFQPYFDEGTLDYAPFNACGDYAIHLERSGETISAGSRAANLVVFANYVLDSLPMDFFWSSEGTLYESLVNVYSPEPQPDFGRPGTLANMRLHFLRQPVASSEYYPDAAYNHVLAEGARAFEDSTFALPLGAMQLLDTLRGMTEGNLLAVIADKGFHRGPNLRSDREPDVAVHGSTFSILVNYRVLGAYTAVRGGDILASDHGHAHLNLAGLLFGGGDHPETRLAFQDALQFGPDEYFTLKQHFEKQYGSLDEFLAVLRLGCYDDRLFLSAYDSLMPLLEQAGPEIKQDLALAFEEAWQNYFPIGEPINSEYIVAVLLAKMQLYAEALVFLRRSEEAHGDRPLVAYTRGLCQLRLGELDPARDSLKRALEMDPNLAPAQNLLQEIDASGPAGD